jgi:hypothetical protein
MVHGIISPERTGSENLPWGTIVLEESGCSVWQDRFFPLA